MVTREKGAGGEVEGKEGQMDGEERQLTLGGECTMQFADRVLWKYELEAYMILLTNGIPINLMKIKLGCKIKF